MLSSDKIPWCTQLSHSKKIWNFNPSYNYLYLLHQCLVYNLLFYCISFCICNKFCFRVNHNSSSCAGPTMPLTQLKRQQCGDPSPDPQTHKSDNCCLMTVIKVCHQRWNASQFSELFSMWKEKFMLELMKCKSLQSKLHHSSLCDIGNPLSSSLSPNQ